MKHSISTQSPADLFSVLKQLYTKITNSFEKETDEQELPTLRMCYMIDDYTEEVNELNERYHELVE